MMSTLLASITTGLMVTYIFLVYNICKYYYQSMRTEIKRITILFACFNISYLFRLIYECLLGKDYYIQLIQRKVLRKSLVTWIPVVFDLTSILAILILHVISFKNTKGAKKMNMPQAGHFNEKGGMPKAGDTSMLSRISEGERPTLVL